MATKLKWLNANNNSRKNHSLNEYQIFFLIANLEGREKKNKGTKVLGSLQVS